MGTGWQGVRKWCLEIAGAFGALSTAMSAAPLGNNDLLIIHVDADIASHHEMMCARPCPPAWGTVAEVRERVLGWCSDRVPPDRVVVCVPSKATEAWVFASLHHHDRLCNQTLECRDEPEALLVGRPDKLVRSKDGGYQKRWQNYETATKRISSGWPEAMARCVEARRFYYHVKRALGEWPTSIGA